LKLTNIHFLGPQPKTMVAAWLRKACCSLFVVKSVPFLATASPNKLFDAFAAGVPTVQTTQGWIKSLLDREQCGLTVPPDEPELFADAVVRLAHDKDLRDRLAANSRRVGVELFDRTLLAEKMRRILANASVAARAGRTGEAVQGVQDQSGRTALVTGSAQPE
jgi:glycosyltransferase involved in cell wall biosynthesis